MASRSQLALLLLASGIATGPALARAQTAAPQANPAPCTVAPQPAPCGTSPAKPNASEKFPFPGETPAPAPPTVTPTPAPPDAPQTPSGENFPFPGETSPAPSSGSSSSSSSSNDNPLLPDPSSPDPADPTAPALTDKGSEGATPGRHLLHRVNPIGTKLQTNDEREAEDLDIAHYYTTTGDFAGAYLRAQDAVKTVPEDPDAHFALAEIARKLDKKDQAIAEYEACLKLDPEEKKAAAARKALAKLK